MSALCVRDGEAFREATQAEIDVSASEQMIQNAAVGRALINPPNYFTLDCDCGNWEVSFLDAAEGEFIYFNADSLYDALVAAGLIEESKCAN